MKIRRPCIAVLFSVLLALSLIGCGGTSSSPKNGDAANEVQEEPQYKLDNTTDVEAELVSLDSDGVTFRIVSKHSNVLFMPQYFEAAGNSYSIFDAEGNHNPQVTLRANGEDIDAAIECLEGKEYEVFVSLEGVSDYSDLKINVDETLYSDSGGKSFPIKDVVLTVSSY